MICKRIFYFLFYISFLYRSTFVLSDSTTGVPVETDASPVDPNGQASPAPTAGAPVTQTAPVPTVPDASASVASPTFVDPNGALAGTQPMATTITHVAQASSAPIAGAQVATHVTPGGQAMATPMNFAAPVTSGAEVATQVTPGAQAVTLGAPVTQTAPVPTVPDANSGLPSSTFVDPNGALAGTQPMATTITHGAQAPAGPVAGAPLTMGTPVAGSPLTMGTPVAGSPLTMGTPVAGSPLTMGTPVAGAPLTMGTPVAGAPLTMGTPVAGAQVATQVTPGSQAMATPMTYATQVGATIAGAPVATSVTVPIPPDSSTQFLAAPFTPASQPIATTITQGTQQIASPTSHASHIVTTSANQGAPPVTIPLNGNPASPSSNLQKVQIDIITGKADRAEVKYRRDDANGTDIFYANEGYIISQINFNGKKRWPQDNEVKECKKVLYIIDSEGKKTLRVLYADEPEAFDPDNPPKTSTGSTQAMTATAAKGGSLTPPSTETTASYASPEPFMSSFTPTTVPAGYELAANLEDVLSATDPSVLSSASPEHQYKVDENGQVFMEFTVANGQSTSGYGTGSPATKAFTVEEIRASRPGQTIDYEDSDDEFLPGEEESPVDLTTYVTRVGRRVGALETRMDSAEDSIKLILRTLDYQHEILEFRRRFGAKTAPFGADLGSQAYFDYAFKPATSQVSKVLDATQHPSDIKLFVFDAADSTKFVELGKDKYKVKQEGDEIQYVFESAVECKLVTFKDRTVWNHRGTDPHPLGVVFHPEDDKVVVDFEDAIVMYVKKGDLAEDVNLPHTTRKHIVDIPLGKMESEEEDASKVNSDPENGTDVTANAASNGENGTAAEATANEDANAASNETASLAAYSPPVTTETATESPSVPLSEEPAPSPVVDPTPTTDVGTSSSSVQQPDAQVITTTSLPAEPNHTSGVVSAPQTLDSSATPVTQTMAQPVTGTAGQQVVHTAPVTPVANSTAAPIAPAQPAQGASAAPVPQTMAQPVTHTAAVPAEDPSQPVSQTLDSSATPVATPVVDTSATSAEGSTDVATF